MNYVEASRIRLGLGLTLLLLSACNLPLPTSVPPTNSPLQVNRTADFLLVHFYSGPGRFTVAFPTTLDIHEDAFENIRSGEQVEIHQVWSPDNGALWLVQYWDYSREVIAKFTSKELLDKARDEILLGEHAQLSQEHDITLHNAYPGRSIVGEASMRGLGEYDGAFEARVYLAGNRVYAVEAQVYQANWGDRMRLMDPFLESFDIDH